MTSATEAAGRTQGAGKAVRGLETATVDILRGRGAGVGRADPLTREREGGRIDDIEDDKAGRVEVGTDRFGAGMTFRGPPPKLLEGAVKREGIVRSLLFVDFTIAFVTSFLTPIAPFFPALPDDDMEDELDAVEAEELGRAGWEILPAVVEGDPAVRGARPAGTRLTVGFLICIGTGLDRTERTPLLIGTPSVEDVDAKAGVPDVIDADKGEVIPVVDFDPEGIDLEDDGIGTRP
jgi:hypothetical protein